MFTFNTSNKIVNAAKFHSPCSRCLMKRFMKRKIRGEKLKFRQFSHIYSKNVPPHRSIRERVVDLVRKVLRGIGPFSAPDVQTTQRVNYTCRLKKTIYRFVYKTPTNTRMMIFQVSKEHREGHVNI